MLPQVGKQFLVWLGSSWKPLFQGRYLLLTNTLSGGGTMMLGDILEQTREIRSEPDRVREWNRSGRTFVVGCSMGPLLHYWYIWLERLYTGKALSMVGKKILADQLLGSPVFGIGYFLGMALMEGHTLSEGWEEFKNKFWQLYKMNWYVWPPAQMVNFYFLSPKFRVLYINSVALGWDTYVSYLKHRDDSQDADLVSVLPASKPLEEKT